MTAPRTPAAPGSAPAAGASTALAPASSGALGPAGDPDAVLTPEQASGLAALARGAWAGETQRAYARAWRSFEGWCLSAGRRALPAAVETLALYVEHLTQVQPPTSVALLEQRLGAIAQAHALAGFDPPPTASKRVQLLAKAARRRLYREPVPKDPLTADRLRALLPRGQSLTDLRDRAVLLVGFSGAFRREELGAIDVRHLREVPGGLGVLVPRSKTDQAGEGAVVGLASRDDDLCPVRALRAWLDVAGITEGPVFRGFTSQHKPRAGHLTGASIARIVKRYAAAAGLDPAHFAGHSLRAGLVTQAYRDGVPEAQIMATTRHKSATMLARYRREANPVADGASGALDGASKLR